MTTQVRNPELVNLLKADFVNCWIPVAQSVLTAPAATVTFANLPQNYRAVVLVSQARTDRAAERDQIAWQANGDGGNNYDRQYGWFRADGVRGSGGSVPPINRGYCAAAEGATSRANNFSPGMCWWPGYVLADREKQSFGTTSPVFGDASALADFYLWSFGARWRNTNAITSLTFLPEVGANFVAGSRFALYGVL